MIDPLAAPSLAARGAAGQATAELFPALPARDVAHRLRLRVPLRVDVSWVVGFTLATWTFADAVLPLEVPGRSVGAYVTTGAVTALLLLLSIALHEIGHWLAARRDGLGVARITLSLLGGALELDTTPRAAGSEARLALSGPLASLVTAVLAALVHVALVEAGVDPLVAIVPAVIAVGNLAVALLNLLPGLPLDGGRLLRAVIWKATGDESAATHIARRAGHVLGMLLIGLAVVASASGDAAAAIWAAALGLTIQSQA